MPKGQKKEVLTPEQQREQDKKDYLAYQARIAKQNEGKNDEDKVKLLTKPEWIEKKRPSGESKRDIFLRIVDTRVNTALKGIDNIIPLKNYDSTDREKEQIIKALEEAVTEVKSKLLAEETTKQTGFKLEAENA